MKIDMVELQAVYDSRESFYGKAKVLKSGADKYLYSYDTEVAKIINGKLKVIGMYSQTTTRHIREFIKQNGFKSGTKQEIISMYVE